MVHGWMIAVCERRPPNTGQHDAATRKKAVRSPPFAAGIFECVMSASCKESGDCGASSNQPRLCVNESQRVAPVIARSERQSVLESGVLLRDGGGAFRGRGQTRYYSSVVLRQQNFERGVETRLRIICCAPFGARAEAHRLGVLPEKCFAPNSAWRAVSQRDAQAGCRLPQPATAR